MRRSVKLYASLEARRISIALFPQLAIDAETSFGKTLGNDSLPSWSALHPESLPSARSLPDHYKAPRTCPDS